jgi:nucleoside phosphorylase
MLKNQLPSPRAIIFTALSIEYQAVRAHLVQLHEKIHPRGTIYEQGTFFSAKKQSWNVGIVEVGKGNASAAQESERAITYFQPNVILFVGVAGGLKDVRLGDVVAAIKVYGYEAGKVTTTFHIRPNVVSVTYRLEQRIRAEARKSDWLQRIKEPLPKQTPHVFVGPIAAGEKVLASTDSTEWQFLKACYDDALAVETEGYGFFQTAHANPQVEALVIRGISDLIDNKSEADAENSQAIAAHHASAFAFEILAKLGETTSLLLTPLEQPGRSRQPSTGFAAQ